jgi:hypothetical protein
MQYTRIDTAKLTAAVQQAIVKIDEAAALLAPFAVIISAEERASTLRPREAFPAAGRALARAVADYPGIGAASGFDGAAVNEDLDNAEALAPLVEKLTELSRRVDDSKLVWLAEAWVPSLAAYGVAKVAARANAALRTVVAPLAEIFATHRAKKEEAQAAATPAAATTPAAEPAKSGSK